jgi:hypothetical protein
VAVEETGVEFVPNFVRETCDFTDSSHGGILPTNFLYATYFNIILHGEILVSSLFPVVDSQKKQARAEALRRREDCCNERENDIGPQVLGAAINAHWALGLGLLETVYASSGARFCGRTRPLKTAKGQVLPCETSASHSKGCGCDPRRMQTWHQRRIVAHFLREHYRDRRERYH